VTLGSEYTESEKPLLDQLIGLGWSHTEGSKSEPVVTGRESFRESLIENRLREALRNINLGPDGQPWLDDSRLSESVSTLTRTQTGKLIEINERMTERLLEGVSVAGLPDWDQGRSQRIEFIDFDHPERNDFLAVNQFRVDEPGGQAKKFVVPDVVLFVNGIPLVVIECKSPYVTDPMAEGINQLRRYANQRDLGAPEGNEQSSPHTRVSSPSSSTSASGCSATRRRRRTKSTTSKTSSSRVVTISHVRRPVRHH